MEANVTCPTEGGLADDGFNPSFSLNELILDPSSNMHIWGWLGSGLLVVITWILAVHTIMVHLTHYNNKSIQRHKVRVLAYPAVYSTLAWVSYLKYGASTTIMFFAVLFESFAVYNLYALLKAYLEPYRLQNASMPKQAVTTKVLGLKTITVQSKWGLHFSTIMDICVFQFPIWNIISAFISIMTELHGYYCPNSFSPKGAYVWLTVINFFCLSLILGALFTYLAVYHNEWKLGAIQAHGLFWCVKGPIMIIFYFGTILLSALTTFHVIKDVPPANGGTYWPAAAIKNGYEAIIVCFVMAIDAVLMMKYYGMDEEDYFDHKDEHLNFFMAFVDAFLAFIPQFILSLMTCGQSTVRLAKKRQELKLRRKMAGDESSMALNKDFHTKDEERDYSYYEDPMADVSLEDLPPMPRVHQESKVFEEEGKSGTRLRELGAIDNPFKSPPQQHAYPASPYPHTGSSPSPTHGRYSAVATSPFDDENAAHALPPPPSAPPQQQIQTHCTKSYPGFFTLLFSQLFSLIECK
ncbi:hypothetical protein K450DRAFT_253885 [Umbelopsis ramanniana AG]|uniref:Uncharacterized protein n=1 Tax=Umbelopsis ramanniana AG TaxID=1314678 RepID=A0AAD5E584_UMBRA|nr:uncharacterized protein K450DRAFT_253885 [Umbelopsis ramanniana AG]KAI8576999.1 hypothetical protein K450DRAFT_253885 [Umbelopsis ramanniana AG]